MASSNGLSTKPGENGGVLEAPPPVEIKLFVGRVPRTFDEAMLRPIFTEFGQVGDVIIIRDRDTGAHKGCAFVRMASITKADLAIRALNNVKVLDQSLGPLQVKYAAGEPERLGLPSDNGCAGQDQAKLFVGSLPKTCTEDDIRAVFGRFGDLDEVFIMKDDSRGGTGRSGCAFVKFSYKEAAFHAIANLNGKFTMAGSNRAMEVRFAENKKAQAHQQMAMMQSRVGQTSNQWTEYFTNDGRPYYYHATTGHTQWDRPTEMDAAGQTAQLSPSSVSNIPTGAIGAQTHGPPGANVFVFHVPNEWSEHDMLNHFAVYGQIVSARIAADKSTGRNKGFGFISFGDVASAINAVQGMNGYSANGKRLKVQIKKGEEQYADAYLPGVTGIGASNSGGAVGGGAVIGGNNSFVQQPNLSHGPIATQAVGGGTGGAGAALAAAANKSMLVQQGALSAMNNLTGVAMNNTQPGNVSGGLTGHVPGRTAAMQVTPNYPGTLGHLSIANALANAVGTANVGGRGAGASMLGFGGATQQQGYSHTLAHMSAAYQ